MQKRVTKILAPNSSYNECIANFGLTTLKERRATFALGSSRLLRVIQIISLVASCHLLATRSISDQVPEELFLAAVQHRQAQDII